MSDCGCTRRAFAKGSVAMAAGLSVGLRTIVEAQTIQPVESGAITITSPTTFVASTRVVSVSGNTIYTANDAGPATFLVARTVNLWRGQYYRGLSMLSPNDIIDVQGRIAPNGDLYAVEISANLDRVKGDVLSVSGATLLVNAEDGYADDGSQNITLNTVQLNDTVTFMEQSSYSQLASGVKVDVIGLRDYGNGILYGSTIYVG